MEIAGPIGTSVTYFALLFDEKSLPVPEKREVPPGYVGHLAT